MAQSNLAHLSCHHMNRFKIGNVVCTHKLPIKINDFWVIHWVGGSEPIHVNMQVILAKTSIQMIKFEKRKKKGKKVPHWKKNAHVHHLMYIIFMCHHTIGCWGDPKFWQKKKKKKRSTWTLNPKPTTKKDLLPKGCQSKPHLGESNITLPSTPPQGIQLLWECEPGDDDHVMVL